MEALFGSSNPAAMLGGVFGLFVILFLLVLGILWFIFPFAVFGVKPLLRQIIAEQKRTNETLARISQQIHPIAVAVVAAPKPVLQAAPVPSQPPAPTSAPLEDARTLAEIMKDPPKT